MPWKSGKVQVWDATCLDTFAPLYSALFTREPGEVADRAVYEVSISIQTSNAFNIFFQLGLSSKMFGREAMIFSKDLGRRNKEKYRDEMAFPYLHRRISVAILHATLQQGWAQLVPRTIMTIEFNCCCSSSSIHFCLFFSFTNLFSHSFLAILVFIQ